MIAVVLILCVTAVVVGGYLMLPDEPEPVMEKEPVADQPLPRMANLPEKKPTIPPPPPPSYPPDAPVLETARASLREGISPDDAVRQANTLPDGPERADAVFLLLEYAAESGNAEAAERVGMYYDPTDASPSGTIRKNPETAYEWYRTALTGGRKGTEKHLARLRQWVEKQAGQGSSEARQLLQSWR
jgi:hypothetical protein